MRESLWQTSLQGGADITPALNRGSSEANDDSWKTGLVTTKGNTQLIGPLEQTCWCLFCFCFWFWLWGSLAVTCLWERPPFIYEDLVWELAGSLWPYLGLASKLAEHARRETACGVCTCDEWVYKVIGLGTGVKQSPNRFRAKSKPGTCSCACLLLSAESWRRWKSLPSGL